MRASSGGGQVDFERPRIAEARDVAVPPGYHIEVVASGLTFPTGVAFDDRGVPHVTEAGYSYGEVFLTPRLLRVEAGRATPIASGGRNGPWNGVAYHDGAFYVAEGGQLEGGRLLRIAPDGSITTLLSDLPSRADHHTNGPIVGPDGWVYFGQGTATNSAVVGTDNASFGWLTRFPDVHDVPCETVSLTGETYTTDNPLTDDEDDRATTGAYAAFGTVAGPTIAGAIPCNGAVMRVRPDGSDLRLVAWGFRNPFGLAFDPRGRLFVTDNGYDDRGSRPAWGTADYLWAIEEGRWYGWPDYAGGVPFNGERFGPPGGQAPRPVFAETPDEPPRPIAVLGVHSSSNGFDFSRSAAFGHEGEAFIAQFGDMAPGVGKVLHPVGFQVVRVNVETGAVQPFAVNESGRGPASAEGGGGLERPVAARFAPDGRSLYVVDFGVMTVTARGPQPRPGTGVLWRVWREGP